MAAALPLIKIVGVALSAKAAIDGIKEGNFFQAVIGAVGAYYGMSALATPATEAGASGMMAASEGATQAMDAAGASISDQLAGKMAEKGIEAGGGTAFGLSDSVSKGMEGLELFDSTGGLVEGAGNFGLDEAIKGGLDFAGQAAGKGIEAGSGFALGDVVGQEFKNSGFNLNDSIRKGASWLKDKTDFIADPIKDFGRQSGILGKSGAEGSGLLAKGMDFANKNPGIMQTGMTLAGGYMQGRAEEDMYDDQKREFYKSLDRRGYSAPVDDYNNFQFNPNTRRYE